MHSIKSHLQVIATYVTHPIRLIWKNWSALLLFSTLILLDHFLGLSKIKIELNASWAYDILPQILQKIVHSPLVVGAIIFVSLLKSIISSFLSQDMVFMYQGHRKSLINSICNVSVRNVIWFIIAESLVYFVFALIAFSFYFSTYMIWHRMRLDFFILCALAFVLLYPVFYMTLSSIWMISAFPITPKARLKKVQILLTSNNFKRLYAFYGFRVLMESAILLCLPIIITIFMKDVHFIQVAIGFALVAPLALIRGSAYEIKLDLLRNDLEMRVMFDYYYNDTDRALLYEKG